MQEKTTWKNTHTHTHWHVSSKAPSSYEFGWAEWHQVPFIRQINFWAVLRLVALTSHLIFIYWFLLSCFLPEVVQLGLDPWSHSLACQQGQHIPVPWCQEAREMRREQGLIDTVLIIWMAFCKTRKEGFQAATFRQHFLVTMCLALTFLFLMFVLLDFIRKMQFLRIMGLGYELLPSEQQAAAWALPQIPGLNSEMY